MGLLSRWRERRKTRMFDYDPRLVSVVNRNIPEGGESRDKWLRLLSQIDAMEGIESSFGNLVEVLEGGESTVAEMVDAIDQSRDRVWLETYIFDDSPVAESVAESLCSAARRGCDVVVIADYIGSNGLPLRPKLEAAGVTVVLFNPFPWNHYLDPSVPRSVGPVPFRDHRKILVADSVGFCGSMNIQGEVITRPGEEFPAFYDLNAKIHGPAVAHLANVFIDSLTEANTGVSRSAVPPPTACGDVYVQVLQSNVRRERRGIQKALANQIKSADSEIRVASSYFMPPGFLRRALLTKSKTTDTRIVASGGTDFWPVPGDLLAQTHALSRFVDRTSVRLYSRSHMHAKFTVIDSVYTSIGSYNFDRFSSRRNLESAVGVFDRSTAHKMRQIHDRLSLEGNEPTRRYFENPLARFVCWLAYLFVKTSGRNIFDGFDAYRDAGPVATPPRSRFLTGTMEFVSMSLKL
jgi:cardiolipin synthase